MHLLSSRDVIYQKIDANDKRIVPASHFLIYIRPKKDTRIIRIDSNLAVVLYLFCKYILHALTSGVQSTQTSPKGLESVTSDRESGR